LTIVPTLVTDELTTRNTSAGHVTAAVQSQTVERLANGLVKAKFYCAIQVADVVYDLVADL